VSGEVSGLRERAPAGLDDAERAQFVRLLGTLKRNLADKRSP
jgi:hypothetical protein